MLDHPELTLIEFPAWREYRVENSNLVRSGSIGAKTVFGWHWMDAVVPILVACLWPTLTENYVALAILVAAWTVYAYARCTQVLWESVIILPALGLQFETHRGFPLVPLFVSRRFIPLAMLQDFIINEGLHGWNVRYYLATIKRSQSGVIGLEVAYENILPRFPVLLEVYHGVHESLFGGMTVSVSSE